MLIGGGINLCPQTPRLAKNRQCNTKNVFKQLAVFLKCQTRMQEISSSYGLFNEQVFYFFCSQHQDKINSEFFKYFQTTTKYR